MCSSDLAAPARPRRLRDGPRPLRHDPQQAAQDRCPGARQRPTGRRLAGQLVPLPRALLARLGETGAGGTGLVERALLGSRSAAAAVPGEVSANPRLRGLSDRRPVKNAAPNTSRRWTGRSRASWKPSEPEIPTKPRSESVCEKCGLASACVDRHGCRDTRQPRVPIDSMRS